VHCKKTVKWYENIPLLSYIFLRGKCSSCKKAISPRYFVVELLTGLIFLAFYSKFGLGPKLPLFLIVGCGLIVASFIDLDHQLIPDIVSLGGLGLGLIASIFFLDIHFLDSLLGAVVGGVTLYLVGVVGQAIFKKEAMGFGDVKYLAMLGAFLGWQKALLIFFMAPFFGVAVGLIAKIKYKVDTIPYGPYLSLAAVVVILFGEEILNTIFYL